MPCDVSVIVPCFNAQRFLGEAIESALAQTCAPSEIIVVDDKSTDSSVAVARSFGPPVRVIESEANSGTAAQPKAIGLSAAHSEFVALLDADDVWVKHKLERQLPLFRDPEVGLVYAQAQSFATGQPPDGTPWPEELPTGRVCTEFYFRCYAPNSTVVARREALLSVGGFDPTMGPCEDYDLWLRTSFAWKVAAVPEVLMWYRIHPKQLSAGRLKQAHVHRLIEDRHAQTLRRLTGISETDRRQGIVQRLVGHLAAEFYIHRNLLLARMYADLIEEHFPEIDATTREKVRRLRRLTYLPRVLFQVRDRLFSPTLP